MRDTDGEMFVKTITGLMDSITSSQSLIETTRNGYMMKEEDYQRIRWLLDIQMETTYTIEDDVIVHDSTVCPHDHYDLGNGECFFRPHDVWWAANIQLAIRRLSKYITEEKEDD